MRFISFLDLDIAEKNYTLAQNLTAIFYICGCGLCFFSKSLQHYLIH